MKTIQLIQRSDQIFTGQRSCTAHRQQAENSDGTCSKKHIVRFEGSSQDTSVSHAVMLNRERHRWRDRAGFIVCSQTSNFTTQKIPESKVPCLRQTRSTCCFFGYETEIELICLYSHWAVWDTALKICNCWCQRAKSFLHLLILWLRNDNESKMYNSIWD